MDELQQALSIINSGSGALTGGSSAVNSGSSAITGLINLIQAIQNVAPR